MTASNQQMETEDEIKTSNKDEVMKIILEKGSVLESSVSHHRYLFPSLGWQSLGCVNPPSPANSSVLTVSSPRKRFPSGRDPRTTPWAPWSLTEPLSRPERYPLTSRTVLV